VYIPLTVYWLILFLLTSLPSSKLPDAKLNDKIEHSLAFAILAVLLSLAFHFQKKIKILYSKPFFSTVLLIAVYGMLDELHQLYVPGRYCDINDWIADVLGGLVGVGIVLIIKKLSKERVIN
jgi:VanZ family protein